MQGERLTDTTPVIRNNFNNLNVARPQAITTDSMNWVINTLLDKSCIRPRTPGKLHRTEIMQCHAFRKYFDTTLTFSGMSAIHSERLMGHDLGLKERYTKISDEELLEGNDKNIGYIGAIDDLTIDESNILRRKLKEEGIEHSKEWNLLRQELDDFKKQFKIKKL